MLCRIQQSCRRWLRVVSLLWAELLPHELSCLCLDAVCLHQLRVRWWRQLALTTCRQLPWVQRGAVMSHQHSHHQVLPTLFAMNCCRRQQLSTQRTSHSHWYRSQQLSSASFQCWCWLADTVVTSILPINIELIELFLAV